MDKITIEHPIIESYVTTEIEVMRAQPLFVKVSYIIRDGIEGSVFRLDCRLQPQELKLIGKQAAKLVPIVLGQEPECPDFFIEAIVNFSNLFERA